MSRDDKKVLEQVALDVAGQLMDVGVSYGIKPIRSRSVPAMQVWSMNTDGWSAHVGRIGGRGPALEVWFDRWTNKRSRRFYAGLSATAPAIRRIIDSVPATLAPVARFTPKDVDWDSRLHLKNGLPTHHFGTPIHEDFPGCAFYGIYFDRTPGSVRSRTLIAEDAVRFFLQVAETWMRTDDDAHHGLEQRVLRTHVRFERNAKAAKRCKMRDGYRCRVCSFSFEKTYGAIGREFAEAHHVIPLSEIGDSNVCKVDDLITVCANCHRMLHRLEDGELVDWRTLRKRLRTKLKAAA